LEKLQLLLKELKKLAAPVRRKIQNMIAGVRGWDPNPDK